MSDLFHEEVTDEQLDQKFAVMALCPQHLFFVLTKRPERMREYMRWVSNHHYEMPHDMPDRIGPIMNKMQGQPTDTPRIDARWPLPNVWLGVTAEDQARADERIPILLDTPAAKRFVSIEPMLGAVDLRPYLPGPCQHPECENGCVPALGDFPGYRPCPWCELGAEDRLDWVICGGESGPHARPAHPDWFRGLRDQCAEAGVPFHFKQHGVWVGLKANDGEWLTNSETMIRLNEAGKRADEGWPMQRVGLRWAGHLLDGVEYRQFPEVGA
ncbi:MAG: phage Gp37/Gp68 family protein [Proteobacteria bacterium]|nr:phage Gp37/Gp68 family protein [Pseudomonadota bacterium]